MLAPGDLRPVHNYSPRVTPGGTRHLAYNSANVCLFYIMCYFYFATVQTEINQSTSVMFVVNICRTYIGLTLSLVNKMPSYGLWVVVYHHDAIVVCRLRPIELCYLKIVSNI